MKATDKPTQHILVRAYTDSESDICTFAIITISDTWKEQQIKTISAFNNVKDNNNFLLMNFTAKEESVNFYRERILNLDETPTPNLKKILGKRYWSFVELKKGEKEKFSSPENTMSYCIMKIDSYGNFHYMATAKNSTDKYYTTEIQLTDIIKGK